MDGQRILSIFRSISDIDEPTSCENFLIKTQYSNSPKLQRFHKGFERHRVKKSHKLSDNPTIKFFQTISRRRIKPHEDESEQEQSSNKSPSTSQTKQTEYLPFDRDRLFERINTFQKRSNWDIDDTRLNPLTIARNGWRCNTSNLNEMICVNCHAALIIKLSTFHNQNDEIDGSEDEIDFTEQINAKLVDKYLSQLHQSHRINCPWRKQITPLSTYQITFPNLSKELETFKSLYLHNLSYLSEISGLKVLSVLTSEDKEVGAKWLKLNRLEYCESLFEISLLGWEITHEASRVLLSSKSDARRFFINDEPVNLLDEHYTWSKYVDGYKVLLKILLASSTEVKISTFEDRNDNDEKNEDDFDYKDGYDQDVKKTSVEGTLDKLDKLRELYFS